MRDLLDLIQILSEGTDLKPSEFTKRPKRFETFIKKIKAGEPLTTVDGQEVYIAKSEAQRFASNWDPQQHKFIDSKDAQYAQLAKGTSYNEESFIPLSKLKKTTEFGGAAVAVGADPSTGGKESFLLKPQNIGITGKDFPAADLLDIITQNQILNSTPHGKIVIQLAWNIASGESVVIPEEARSNDKLRAAIQDNAGEYLGLLALLFRRSKFNKREDFEAWLGGKIDDLTINFAVGENVPLLDSFAKITNKNTSHEIRISSKGGGSGAAPALSGLKIPDHITKNSKLKNGVAFVRLCQEKDTITQVFEGMDLIFQSNPKSISKEWHKFLPFSNNLKLKEKIIANYKGNPITLSKDWQGILALANVVSAEANDGGKIIYSIKKEVMNAINKRDGLPEFQAMILEILEMNFIQQYADYKKGELTFQTQWPAKLNGNISVESKTSAKDPTSGGFSFKLGRTDDDLSSEPGEERIDDEPIMPDVSDVAADITNPKSSSQKEKPTFDVGRKKR